MFEAFIKTLISIAVLVLAVIFLFWFLAVLGLPFPARAEPIIWLIVALIAVLIVWRFLWPHVSGRWFP